MTTPVIAFKEVHKTYHFGPIWNRQMTRALDPTSFRIEPGEMVAVVGESGSGKTTLARLCLGLTEPSGGTVFFEGAPIRHHKGRLGGKLAAVLQNTSMSLDPRMTIAASIAEPMRLVGSFDPERMPFLLERVGLSATFANRLPHQLSGGQRQRVAIARSLSTTPKLIVFDEAVSALDVSVQAQVLNLILDLRKEVEFAGMFITHDIAVARYIADRVLVMRTGAVQNEISATELYSISGHPYTRMLQSASGLV